MDQEQKPRERSFIRELVPDWRPTRKQVLWAIRIVLVLVAVLGILTLIGLPFDITLWEWAKLLIVPAALAGGVAWLNWAQRQRELEADAARERDRQAQEARREREREAEAAQREREREATEVARRERELEVENQRAQDAALQAYLDHMSLLLTDKARPLHRAQLGDSLSTVARARTLTVLRRLEGERKGSIVQFLYESGLIIKSRPVLSIKGADLMKAHLRGTDLRAADLGGAYLMEADLTGADARGTDLGGHELVEFWASRPEIDRPPWWIRTAKWGGAILRGADLRDAYLVGTNLSKTNLSGADLSEANLHEADLSGADLSNAIGVTNEQLEQQAWSLEGATMPNGQRYEDWLKSKGSGEHGENSGAS